MKGKKRLIPFSLSTTMDAPMARFLGFPSEMFTRVLEFFVVQELNLLPHLQSCANMQCSVVRQYHKNLGTIRSVSRAFDAHIRASAVTLYCISLSTSNFVSPARYPNLAGQLNMTLAIDIREGNLDGHIPGNVALRLAQLTTQTRSLVRLAMTGNVRTDDGPGFMQNMLECMVNLRDLAVESLSVLLLWLPMDLLCFIRASLNVRHLKAHHFMTWMNEEPSVAWTRLESLDFYLLGNQNETLTRYLGADVYDRLRKIALSIEGPTTQIAPLLSRATQLTDLTILYDPMRTALPGLPECDTLQSIKCFVTTGTRLIQRRFPALDTVILEGIKREIKGAIRIPQIRRSRFLDEFLVHLKIHRYLPVVRTVKISDFRTEDFTEYPWHLDELTTYAYWGVHSRDTTFHFDLVDQENRHLLPSGFEVGIRRMTTIQQDG